MNAEEAEAAVFDKFSARNSELAADLIQYAAVAADGNTATVIGSLAKALTFVAVKALGPERTVEFLDLVKAGIKIEGKSNEAPAKTELP